MDDTDTERLAAEKLAVGIFEADKSSRRSDLGDDHIAQMEDVLAYLGCNMNDPNFGDTPARWMNYISEYIQPYDPRDDLEVSFPIEAGFHSMVVQSNIPFEGVCAHHLVPFIGKAHVGYVPNEGVVGLSKLARVVWGVAHRMPSIQESIGEEIADAYMEFLKPAGVIVVLQAEHGCMACRGINRAGIVTSTSCLRGMFRDVPHAREEFFQLIASRRDL